MNNLEVVKNYFSLFLNGEIDDASQLIDDAAVWTIKGSDNVPTVGIWKGKEQINTFFERFSCNFEPQEFNILHYFASEDKVFVVGNFTHYLKPTGKTISSDWMIEFSVNNNKITGYKILEDSYALYLSFLKN